MAVEYGEPHGRSPAARARSATTDPNPLVAAIPSNEYTALARECSHRLATVDIRYDLAWTFGPFLRELPKRIGTNAALDAGLTALMSAVSDLALGYRSPETVIQYGCALKALRKCLADEVVAQSSNTLCAIYLIWVTMVSSLRRTQTKPSKSAHSSPDSGRDREHPAMRPRGGVGANLGHDALQNIDRSIRPNAPACSCRFSGKQSRLSYPC